MSISSLRGLLPPEDHPARPYYSRQNLQSALQQAKEKLHEWRYEDDPHGYCHERPMLLQLVIAAQLWLDSE